MNFNKETKVRREIPDRMMSATFALPIDERRVVGILDYIASDTGISSILIFKIDNSLDGTPYCLYFLSSHFFSSFVLLLLLIILKSLFLSNLILLFSLRINGNTI